MVSVQWFCFSRSCGQTLQGRGSDASWFVDGPPRSKGTVLAIGLIVLIAHLFRGDRPWICFGLSPVVDRVPS